MIQRKFVGDDDLWTKYGRFSIELKEHYGLPSQAHVRLRREGKNGGETLTLVDVCRRKPARDGYDKGNFTIGREALEFVVEMQGQGNRRDPGQVDAAYVVLCEEFNYGPIVASNMAKNVLDRLKHIKPYQNSDNGQEYWVVTEDLEPIGQGWQGPEITDPPFSRRGFGSR